MTDHQFVEARKLVDGGMSINKAAAQVGIPYATLYRWLRKVGNPQANTEPELPPELEAEAEPWRTIRRHENDTRKNQGLPPLTDEQWAAEKAAAQECQRQTEQLWRRTND